MEVMNYYIITVLYWKQSEILVTFAITSQDTMMMGADYYQTEAEIAATLAAGHVPIGIGKDSKIL